MKSYPSLFRYIRNMIYVWLIASILLSPVLGRTLDFNLPDMGDPSAAAITPTEEVEIGKAFLARLRVKDRIIEDPEINDYINYLGSRIAAQTNHGAAGFRFFIVNDLSVNAFAAPGGYIGIHSGLFRVEQTEGEMAAVLAHETAHITQRHLARTFQMANQYTLPVAVALISAILIGNASPDMAQAAIATTIAGQAQSQVNFTRANEKEADRVGLSFLISAGYDANNMAHGFQRLMDATKLYGEGPPEYLRTHPLTANRVAEAQNRADQLERIPPENDLPYQLVRAKLRILSTRKSDALKHFQALNKENPSSPKQVANRYGYALALAENGQTKKSLLILEQLLANDLERSAYHIAIIDVLSKSDRLDEAKTRISAALKLWPGSYPITMLKAKNQIAGRFYKEAADSLERLIQQRPNNPNIYELSSLAKERSGDRAGAYLDLARQYELLGRLETAIQQLRLAQRLDNVDDLKAAKIDAKLSELESLEKSMQDR